MRTATPDKAGGAGAIRAPKTGGAQLKPLSLCERGWGEGAFRVGPKQRSIPGTAQPSPDALRASTSPGGRGAQFFGIRVTSGHRAIS